MLLVVLAFWVPGTAVGLALRLRGWTLLACGPLLTFGAVAAGTFVIGTLGAKWSAWSFTAWVLTVVLIIGGASWLLRRRARTRPAATADETAQPVGGEDGAAASARSDRPVDEPRRLREHFVVAVGVLLGLVVGARTFQRGVDNVAKTVNQDFDSPFHANAVRWIAEHGNPLPADLAPIANSAGATDFFYPNTYHALLALLLDHGGLAMPALLNLAALMTILVVPIGIAAMGMAWRMPPVAVAVAAAASTWFNAFPYDQLWRGPLWPYSAALALIPALLALARHLVVPRGLAGPVGVALGLTGMIGLHPSLIFVVGIYAVALLCAMLLRVEAVRWRTTVPAVVLTGAVLLLLAAPTLLPAFRRKGATLGYRWPEIASPIEAFGQALAFSPTLYVPRWLLGLAALVGIGLMLAHRRLVWVAIAYVGFAALYIGDAAYDTDLVNLVTGPFYNDAWRLAALLPVAGALAVGELFYTVAKRSESLVARRIGGRHDTWPVLPAVCAALMVAVLAIQQDRAYIRANAERLNWHNRDGPVVSHHEIAGYAWLADRVGPNERVANAVRDGSVWMYALSKVQPVQWTYFGTIEGSDEYYLAKHLNEMDHNPRIRPLIAKFRVRYVIAGKGMVQGAGQLDAGLENLDDVAGLRRVYANPDVSIYEVSSATP
ncbi:MAG TPA: DUF6541 family protein [Micromonosporaceae bacterium]|nr:DUF6541 family protein [Micromonosporaceae bacterium]